MLTLLATVLGIVMALIMATGLLGAILQQSREPPFAGAFFIALLLLGFI